VKKYLALLLALTMVLAALPAAAAQQGSSEDETVQVVVTVVEDETDPGESDQEEPVENEAEDPAENEEEEAAETEDGTENEDEDAGDEDQDAGEGEEAAEDEDEDENEDENEDEDEDEDTDPGLLPDSPFYFFKRLLENIKVWLTFNQERKTELLAELVEKRAAELKALEEKYADKELSKRQQRVLQRAIANLEESAEGLFDRLLEDVEAEELEELELTDEAVASLEVALKNMGRAMERVERCAECEECDEDEDCPVHRKMEKYQERIRHLEQIRDRNPEAARDGLNRAIENARRQQRRWAEKHGLSLEDFDDDAEDEPADEDEGNPGKGQLKEKKNNGNIGKGQLKEKKNKGKDK